MNTPASGSSPSCRRQAAGPVTGADRINSLDTIRGVAILGILPMNALAFGLDQAAYFNVSADGIGQPLDWILGVLTMVFIDQKMMALLFAVGTAHAALWFGDVLALYAMCAPVVLLLRIRQRCPAVPIRSFIRGNADERRPAPTAHNPKVAGSNPGPATTWKARKH